MTIEQDREGVLPAQDQLETQLQAEIVANGFAVVHQPVRFVHKSASTGEDVYDFNEDDLPLRAGEIYLDYVVLDQTPPGTPTMASRVLLFDEDRIRVLNSRGPSEDIDHTRRVAQRQHFTILADDPYWGLIAVKPIQAAQTQPAQ